MLLGWSALSGKMQGLQVEGTIQLHYVLEVHSIVLFSFSVVSLAGMFN
jgi:hypothetical protein